MKITVFNNKTGLIHGKDPRHLSCDKPGLLVIGRYEINIDKTQYTLPNLFNGETLDHLATYTTTDGTVYNLGKLAIKGGWIMPPSQTALDIMDLRCRLEQAEKERDEMRDKIRELEEQFDTDALNFLIK